MSQPPATLIAGQDADQDTREKIVRQFAADVGLKLKPEVVQFMASCRCDTISGLRGYVLRLKMASFIQRRPASLALAKRFCS